MSLNGNCPHTDLECLEPDLPLDDCTGNNLPRRLIGGQIFLDYFLWELLHGSCGMGGGSRWVWAHFWKLPMFVHGRLRPVNWYLQICSYLQDAEYFHISHSFSSKLHSYKKHTEWPKKKRGLIYIYKVP